MTDNMTDNMTDKLPTAEKKRQTDRLKVTILKAVASSRAILRRIELGVDEPVVSPVSAAEDLRRVAARLERTVLELEACLPEAK